ncbi:probable crossover junction endonuclease EME2 isoform X2 [Nerophis lumbriciformis]|uniref:probable crossover junction endonuclease EME2 isoform X2 n=1 Tax=Nerophis lumbriciformis TaxID=546530 RepID=UPI002ADF1F31|nr:probable crossover junction endonuclease EME2 isoform X2 [Nerophis lumbriciformis]
MNEIKLKYKNHSFWTLTGHRHRIMLRSGTSGCTHVAGKCVKRVKMTTLPTPKIWEISDSDNDGDEGAQGDLKGSSCVKFALAPPLSDGCERPSPSKKRRSREELEADKEKARERKDAREKKRAAKVLEREEKRKELQKRKEAAEHVNSLKPENFIKCFTVCIDPVVLQQEGSDILLGTLSSNEWKYRIEQQQLPNSITWTRDLPQGEEGGETVEEDQVVQVLGATEFLDMLISVKTIIDSKGEDSTLCRDAAKVLSVLVTDARSSYKRRGYETVQSKYGGENVNVEEVLVYLQLYKNVSVVFLDGWQEVTDHICAVTKSLSKRPSKLLSEKVELPFCVDGSWGSGARVEKDGSGLKHVWSKQIQQLNRVSPAVASCVSAAYPSPQLLLQAYTASSSEEDKKKLLADLVIKGEGKDRRIGPEISARLYRCFTTQNPELVLD